MKNEEWLKGLLDQTDYFDVIYSSNCFNNSNLPVMSNKEIKIPYSNLKYAQD